MAYEPQNWTTKTPITPERLNHMEEGISNSVDLDSKQTIDGIKTFSQLPLSDEVPSENNQLVNKSYVDSIIKKGTVSGTCGTDGYLALGKTIDEVIILEIWETKRNNVMIKPYLYNKQWWLKCTTNGYGAFSSSIEINANYLYIDVK